MGITRPGWRMQLGREGSSPGLRSPGTAKLPSSPRSGPHFLPDQHFACSPVRRQAVNQSPSPSGQALHSRAAEEDVALEGWGEIISAAKETAPVGVALVGPCCTSSYGFLHRHGCCTKDFSLQLSITALGIAVSEPCIQCLKMDARIPLEVPARASVPLCSCCAQKGTGLLQACDTMKKKKKNIYLLYSACPGLQSMCSSWIAGACFRPCGPLPGRWSV